MSFAVNTFKKVMRDLGSLGQFIFGAWCSSVGLTANGSQIDKTGWDFFVEFPLKQEDKLPKDMLPAPIECKIQVKSTDKRKRKLSITVSNLNRLVKAQMPAFFCFIEFDGKNEAQSAYLVHVGKEIIEKTLKRVRELESKGDGNKLNKHEITVHYGDNDRLADTTGESLKSAIERYIPDGMEKYIEDKNELLKTLGFENCRGQLNFTVAGHDPVRDMMDLTLGIRKEINIDNCINYYSRFGILSNEPFHKSERAILALKAKPIKANVKFREDNFSPVVSFKANLYISPLNQFVSEEYIKFRIESRLFEIIIEPFNEKINFSYCFDNIEQMPLNELRDFLKILVLFKQTSNELIIEIELECEDLSLIPLRVSPKNQVHDWSRIYELAKMAISICHQFDISESRILTSIDELIKSSKFINLFYEIFYRQPKTVMIDFIDKEQEYQQISNTVCTSFIKTTVGNHTIGCCLGLEGFLSLIDESKYRLISDNLFIGKKLVTTGNDVIDKEVIDRELDRFEEELKKEEIVIIRIGQFPQNDT